MACLPRPRRNVSEERRRSVITARRCTVRNCTVWETIAAVGLRSWCDNSEMKSVAVIGASSDRRKFGNKAFRAFQQEGHHVIPINPNEPTVEGVPTYASVLDVPDTIDMATV